MNPTAKVWEAVNDDSAQKETLEAGRRAVEDYLRRNGYEVLWMNGPRWESVAAAVTAPGTSP